MAPVSQLIQIITNLLFFFVCYKIGLLDLQDVIKSWREATWVINVEEMTIYLT